VQLYTIELMEEMSKSQTLDGGFELHPLTMKKCHCNMLETHRECGVALSRYKQKC